MLTKDNNSLAFLVLLWLTFFSADGKQSIVVRPKDTFVAKGETATLACSVADRVGWVQWRRDTLQFVYSKLIPDHDRLSMANDGNTIPRPTSGVENFSLTLRDAESDDSGTYSCLVQSGGGEDTPVEVEATAVLIVTVPEFSLKPDDVTLNEGDQATLRCSVTNKGKVEVQWSKCGFFLGDRSSLLNNRDYYMQEEQEGTNNFDLVIVHASLKDHGTFACVIPPTRHTAGREAVATVNIKVSPTPRVVFSDGLTRAEYRGRPIRFEENPGKRLLLECNGKIPVTRRQDLVVAWVIGRKLVKGVEKTEVLEGDKNCQKTRTLFSVSQWINVSRSRSHHQGDFRCEVRHVGRDDVRDKVGSVSVQIEVEFHPAELIMTAEEGKHKAGDEAHLTCSSRYSNPAAPVHWFFNDKEITKKETITRQTLGPYRKDGYETIALLVLRVDATMNGANLSCRTLYNNGAVQLQKSIRLEVSWIPHGQTCDLESVASGCGTGQSCQANSKCGCDDGLNYDNTADSCKTAANRIPHKERFLLDAKMASNEEVEGKDAVEQSLVSDDQSDMVDDDTTMNTATNDDSTMNTAASSRDEEYTEGESTEEEDSSKVSDAIDESEYDSSEEEKSPSKKHQNFTNEPMGGKPVTAIPGIGETLGVRMSAKGFDKADDVYAKFSKLDTSAREVKFKVWHRDMCRSNKGQQEQSFQAMNKWHHQFHQ